MKIPWLLIPVFALWMASLGSAQAPTDTPRANAPATAPTTRPMTRFASIDLFIDPLGKPLGAYQIEFKSTRGEVKLVGVEGGAEQAFKAAPYYDPRALQQSRIILAAFSTDSSLPSTNTRIARLHVQISGDVVPEYDLKLIVAGDRDAKPIKATASFATDTK